MNYNINPAPQPAFKYVSEEMAQSRIRYFLKEQSKKSSITPGVTGWEPHSFLTPPKKNTQRDIDDSIIDKMRTKLMLTDPIAQAASQIDLHRDVLCEICGQPAFEMLGCIPCREEILAKNKEILFGKI